MGDATKIQWTDASWNPVRGCSRVSEGCRNCYAERVATRFSGPGQPYEGLVNLVGKATRHGQNGRATTGVRGRWNGTVRMVPEHLADPLKWKRPRRIFVNSMSDLFHEALTNEQIAAVFGVMAAAPQHTFQVLTKRAKRMREWFAWVSTEYREARSPAWTSGIDDERMVCVQCAEAALGRRVYGLGPWPIPNVHLGVSVEDQASADERIPDLLATPAAVRWVSYEPALGPVDFATNCDGHEWLDDIDWIVVGGESGPGARPFDVEWARSTIAACKAAGVPCFVKQLGSKPGHVEDGHQWCVLQLRDSKGGDPSEWPKDLRVREWPRTKAEA